MTTPYISTTETEELNWLALRLNLGPDDWPSDASPREMLEDLQTVGGLVGVSFPRSRQSAPREALPEVTADDILTMTREVTLGVKREDSVLAPMRPAQRAAWFRVVRDVRAIEARGGVVDIPFGS